MDALTTAVEDSLHVSDPYQGLKPRRRSSATKVFTGDNLQVEKHAGFRQICGSGDENPVILFSDYVGRMDYRNVMTQIVLVITDTTIYILDAETDMKLLQVIPVACISHLSLSALPDNFFAIHTSMTCDALMISKRKSEIITMITDAYKDTVKKELSISLENSFEYNIREGDRRTIRFDRNLAAGEEGVSYHMAAPPRDQQAPQTLWR